MAVSVVYVSSRRATATVQRIHAPLTQCQVAVNFNPRLYAQKTSAHLDAAIEKLWKEKTTCNSHLFNASKFRLAKCVSRQDGKLGINLGLTCYKDLCGTNLSEHVEEYVEAGAREYQDRYSYMSQALGVGLLLMTSDHQLVLLKRATWTGEAGGCWDRPGGHPEPGSVEGLQTDPQKNQEGDAESPNCQTSLEADILAELWSSTANEAGDEVGVPPPTDLRLMGLSCKADAGDRPSLEFVASVPQTGSEVRTAYDSGHHAEADESTALLLLTPGDVEDLVVLLRRRYTVVETGAAAGEGETIRGVKTVVHQEEAGSRNLSVEVLEEVALNCAPALVGALLLAGGGVC